LKLDAPFYYWQEHERPADLVLSRLTEQFGTSCHIALDEMTTAVQKAAAAILHEGSSNVDIKAFLDKAHLKVGADGSSTFKLLSFGEGSGYPHGVPDPLYLTDGDTVLVDTGTTVCGYNSDITRSYVFGTPSDKQREIWDIELKAQLAGFTAAIIGNPCRDVDDAARGCVKTLRMYNHMECLPRELRECFGYVVY